MTTSKQFKLNILMLHFNEVKKKKKINENSCGFPERVRESKIPFPQYLKKVQMD